MRRQPVHTVYGGADLFGPETPKKLGSVALRTLDAYAPDVESFARILSLTDERRAATIYERIRAKLASEPIEDFRLDFEDGYGARPDDEEDRHAVSAAIAVAEAADGGVLPPFIGIRVKPLTEELHVRSRRTLDLFLTELVARLGRVPDGFVVTLPKIEVPEQVEIFADILADHEARLGLASGTLGMELMIETPTSIISSDGRLGVMDLVDRGAGRVTGAHFGTYDYTALLSITATHQSHMHPACDFARHVMQVSLAQTGIFISDGATNVMPVAPHRGTDLTVEQGAENTASIHHGWQTHHGHIQRSLSRGIYQGWDLHPAQLVTRFAAVYGFFLHGLDDAAARLRGFLGTAARASMVGGVFDDAATGQGLINFFVRATNCGALTRDETELHTGLALEVLHSRSFSAIVGAIQENDRGNKER